MILVNQSCSINFNNSITEQHYFKSFTCENIIGLHARISLIVFLTSYHTRLLNKRNIIFRESITRRSSQQNERQDRNRVVIILAHGARNKASDSIFYNTQAAIEFHSSWCRLLLRSPLCYPLSAQ